jgi:hypothetical protein
VFGERHLRHVLLSYMDYAARTHLSLCKMHPFNVEFSDLGLSWSGPISADSIINMLFYGRDKVRSTDGPNDAAEDIRRL